MKRKTFCIECLDDTEYTVVEETDTHEVRGVSFSYMNQKAICCKCGCEVYVAEISDANIDRREKAYAEAAGVEYPLTRRRSQI